MSSYPAEPSILVAQARPARVPMRIWLGFAAMCLGMFMAILDIQVVATSLPDIRAALDIGTDQMSWIQTTYLIAEIVAIPLIPISTSSNAPCARPTCGLEPALYSSPKTRPRSGSKWAGMCFISSRGLQHCAGRRQSERPEVDMVRCVKLAMLTLCGALVVPQSTLADDDEFATDANITTGLDVSSSMDEQETMLQVDGMAKAIRAPEIVAAIQNGRHGRIGFAVFLWSDGDFPELVSWRVIASAEDAEAASSEISSRARSIIWVSSPRSVGTMTNISTALEHAAAMLQSSPYASKRSIVNIVGDGEDNVGEDPSRIRDKLVARGVTINGVVVGGDRNVLEYYRYAVIGGPTGFVLPADKADTLVHVFASKFISEIALNARREALPDRM